MMLEVGKEGRTGENEKKTEGSKMAAVRRNETFDSIERFLICFEI